MWKFHPKWDLTSRSKRTAASKAQLPSTRPYESCSTYRAYVCRTGKIDVISLPEMGYLSMNETTTRLCVDELAAWGGTNTFGSVPKWQSVINIPQCPEVLAVFFGPFYVPRVFLYYSFWIHIQTTRRWCFCWPIWQNGNRGLMDVALAGRLSPRGRRSISTFLR